MAQRTFTLINKRGLHARACARLLAVASEYRSQITLQRGERQASAESLSRMLMLAAGPGSELAVQADGEDAEAALDALERLIADRFGEND